MSRMQTHQDFLVMTFSIRKQYSDALEGPSACCLCNYYIINTKKAPFTLHFGSSLPGNPEERYSHKYCGGTIGF